MKQWVGILPIYPAGSQLYTLLPRARVRIAYRARAHARANARIRPVKCPVLLPEVWGGTGTELRKGIVTHF